MNNPEIAYTITDTDAKTALDKVALSSGENIKIAVNPDQ